jgi:hypothetical protein
MAGTGGTTGTGGTAGTGGMAGMGGGGNGGVGGGSITDCTGLDDNTECTVVYPPYDTDGLCLAGRCVADCTTTPAGNAPCDLDGADGVCDSGFCHVLDCPEGERGTRCIIGTADEIDDFGVCEAGECTARVSDCTGIEPVIECTFGGDATIPALCIDEACVPTTCEGLEDLTACFQRASPGNPPWPGLCLDASCIPTTCNFNGAPFPDGMTCAFEDGTTGSCLDGSCE